MENKNIKLYKLRDDGSIGLKEVNRGMFKDSDSFSQALDFYQLSRNAPFFRTGL